ncbi:von Willebrand factor A domain-containing protein 3A-like isoform X2 [Tubulanus polymorphus]|uniref:von Willebrand factor A domain-containing protein 3A-like isoform X2 n=1 Tax=Tubulanus polymorphus TaxID=672921 RepID=UPI003DA42339
MADRKFREDERYEDVNEEGEEDETEEETDMNFKNSRSKQMMNLQIQLPDWKITQYKDAQPPLELTVTHINQTHDLQRVKDMYASASEGQSSEEWLRNHNIEHLQLTLKDLVDKGKVGKPKPNKETGKMSQHIQFESMDINEFEYKLNLAIEMYTKRIKWLLMGSKRMFGLVKGTKVAVCVDTSDANTGFGRITAFQEALLHLIDEQLSNKKSLYLCAFGSEVNSCWKTVRDVNGRIIDEAKEFVDGLTPSGGCNLLKAMKHVMKLKDINSIVLILGSVPDQNADILCDFVSQMGVGKDMPLHTVAYDCSNHLTNLTLRKLADESKGRYHCYTATCEEQIYTGTDISTLLREIQKVQDVINKIKEMRQGMMGSALISIMNEISTEVSKLPQSRFLPRPPGHEEPLTVEMPKFQPTTSDIWLKQHGLKAKNLDLYQVLAPNAYSFKEEFIPVIRKTVQSQVHEKVMAQFQWHDGSMKNVHVDMAQLFEYQKQLGHTVRLYEKRISWLSNNSRRIFGAIAEQNVVFLIDLSVSNVNYLIHIQHSLRLLMEQQLANKRYFNIIGFGSNPKAWRTAMAKVSPETLQSAWKWILESQCEGSRNFLGALRMALENEEENKHGIEVNGVYLFTSGIPDQVGDVVCSYAEEGCAGRDARIHTILFNVDDYNSSGAIPSRYANITKTADTLRSLAHSTGGRFHWFRETGIIESDDILRLTAEIERAINFSKKCSMLVDSVKRRYSKYQDFADMRPIKTTFSMKHMRETRDNEENPQAKMRPSSAKMDVSSSTNRLMLTRRRSQSSNSLPNTSRDPMVSVRSPIKTNKKAIQQPFYTGEKNKVGLVFKAYPAQKSIRKKIGDPIIPTKEDQVTSKQWLRMYGLNHLHLDLSKLVSGPDCKHVESKVKSLNKNVQAKYCNVFPSVNVKGTIRHLQLMPHEMETYQQKLEIVLKRYLRRLQWLLSGSRRVFGTVIHRKCCILVDTSGSMEPHMDELKKELVALVWDQLYEINARFNVISFSGEVEQWEEMIVPANQENCHSAVQWVSSLKANGNTCTLEALEVAFADADVEAIYLLTDGKPDTSTSLVLREVAKMNETRQVNINTISFNCADSTANNFLKLLAAETGGRYHSCHSDFDADLFAHKLISEGAHDLEYPKLPDFEGDDLKRLGAEIAQARQYLQQCHSFKKMYDSHHGGAGDFVKGMARQDDILGKVENITESEIQWFGDFIRTFVRRTSL